ncbi:hypothetical protein GCM10029976_075440 [Kribbella albertanoniae]|uniref:DUF4429 domain-containing protein n=1 Tax=Kribbella albertanoniae TaxID=1266829 RepID=A0A4V2XRW3_9ACTN|nr:DUF4429 domain-containing protein [Kribbella albertanoniae]TDC31355.1 DUF4429 domain-containing protein [Kribbella albertanoniae]
MLLQTNHGVLEWDGTGTIRVQYDASPRLGERIIPVEALRGVEVSADLRLELREHADPLLSVTGGSFESIYHFEVTDLTAAKRLASEIRIARARRAVPETAAPRWLVATPPAADALEGKDATVAVAQGMLMFAYPRSATRRKKADGNPRSVPLTDILNVEWVARAGRHAGFVRVGTAQTPVDRPKPKHDPAAVRVAPDGELDALFFAARLLTRVQP